MSKKNKDKKSTQSDNVDTTGLDNNHTIVTVPITGHPGLVRDLNTKAVLNNNTQALENARNAKKNRLNNIQRLSTLEKTVADMDSKLNQILSLLNKPVTDNS